MTVTLAEVQWFRTLDEARPKIREDCEEGHRPCPWAACKYNLLIDVIEGGAIVFNAKIRRREGRGRAIVAKPYADEQFLDALDDAIESWFDETKPRRESCALDVAARGGILLEEIADEMIVTRERIRQIEARGLRLLKANGLLLHYAPDWYLDEDDELDHIDIAVTP